MSSYEFFNQKNEDPLVKKVAELKAENERLKEKVEECKELITELVKETKRVLRIK